MDFNICSVQIISNTICFGPSPNAEDGIEQHLMIRRGGQVWIFDYAWGKNNNIVLKQKLQLKISESDVSDIFSLIGNAFLEKDYALATADDVGSWELRIQSGSNRHCFSGPLIPASDPYGISDKIRQILGKKDLILLDGLPQ